jgi:hypothetical protein
MLKLLLNFSKKARYNIFLQKNIYLFKVQNSFQLYKNKKIIKFFCGKCDNLNLTKEPDPYFKLLEMLDTDAGTVYRM